MNPAAVHAEEVGQVPRRGLRHADDPLGIVDRPAYLPVVAEAVRGLGLRRPILWTFLPNLNRLVGRLGESLVIYHCVDEYTAFSGVAQHTLRRARNDPRYRNADSRELLRAVKALLGNRKIVNIDATIVAQAPRMAPHVPQMVKNIAHDLQIAETRVSVKATTTEMLGFAGRGEGIAALAIALLD